MKRTYPIWTQLIATACAALVGCGDPGVGSRSAAIDDKLSPPLTPPPDGPIHVPEGSIVPSQEVGTLPGSLSVTPNGTASYDIPLRVPEGRAGIQPSLALSFDDGNRNGPLGVGWSLAGLSQVSPCPRTTAQDGAPDAVHFNAGDEYCLGGNRLVAVEGVAGQDGTIYRLERDKLIKVVSHGSHGSGQPAEFVAHHPDGTTWVYSKRIEATQVRNEDLAGASPTERTVVWSWALAHVKDRVGNFMSFEYQVIPHAAPTSSFGFDGGRALEFYPSRIRYTAHESGLKAKRSIVFEYQDRPDPIDTFRSGVHRHTGKRLARIVAEAPNPSEVGKVWFYQLRYDQSPGSGRSLLEGVTLCDVAGACLPETTMAWQTTYDGYIQRETGIAVRDGAHMTDMTPADFNGDGRSDLLFWSGERQWCECVDAACLQIEWYPSGDACSEEGSFRVSGEWHIAYSDGSSLGSPEATGLVAEFVTRSHHVAEQPPGAGPDEYNKPIVLDFDGDGAADLMSSRTGEIRSPLEGYALLQDLGSTYETLPAFWEADVRYLGDFDGDGRVDFFSNDDRPVPLLNPTYEGTEVDGWVGPNEWDDYSWSYQLGGGEPGFGARMPAGIQPFMQRFDEVIGFPAVDPVHHSISMDADGDGRTELALPTIGNTFQTFEVAADGSPEIGALNLAYLWHPIPGVTPVSEYVPIYLDINGDGLRDVIASGGADLGAGRIELLARINTGQGFGRWYVAAPGGYRRPPTPWETSGPAIHDNGVRVFDYNGDGRDDFVIPGEDGDDPLVYVSDGVEFHSIVPGFELEDPVGMSPPGAPSQFMGYSHRFGDVDGDGMADLFELDLSTREIVVWQRSSVGPPDTLLHVTNGLGRNESVVRRLLGDAKIYRPGTGCTYPQRCLRAGGYVVTALSRSSADGTLEYYDYDYEDARVDVTGRGFLGFRRRSERVVETGATTRIDYGIDVHQHGAYPLAGIPVAIRSDTPIDAGHHRTVVQTTKHKVKWSFADQVYIVRAVKGVQHIHDLSSAPLADPLPDDAERIELVTREWDGYGNLELEDSRLAGSVEAEGGGGQTFHHGTRTVTDYDYANDETEWLIGVPTGQTVTSYAAAPDMRVESRTTEIVPDSHGRAHKVIVEPNDPRLRHETTYHYGSYGELRQIDRENSPSDPEAAHQLRSDKLGYDTEKLYPRSLCNALGHCSKVAVHPAYGLVVMADDPNGHRVARSYDGFGRARGTTTFEGYQEWIDYEPGWAGSLVERIRTSDGGERTAEYNRAGAPIYVREKGYDGAVSTREITYDQSGRVSTLSNAFFTTVDRRTTSYFHDGLGRVVRVERPDGSVLRNEYTIDEKRSFDGNGNESFVRYDVSGRVTDSVNVHSEDGSLVRSRYAYRPFDALEIVTDPLGHKKQMSYDGLGRHVRLEDPNAGVRTFTYNGFGELIEQTDPEVSAAGTPTTFDRDLLGRVLAIHSVDGTESYTWDTPPPGSSARTWYGARHAAVSADGTETRLEYDAFGRVERERTRVAGTWFDVDHAYDGRSRLEAIHYPAVAASPRFLVKREYGANGALARIVTEDAGGKAHELWRASERNAEGLSTREIYGGKLETVRHYELETGRLDAMRARPLGASSDLFRYEYEYFDNGNLWRKHETVSDFQELYDYDSLDRITLWKRGPAADPKFVTEYDYDEAGNLLKRWFRGGPDDVDESFVRADLASGANALTGYEKAVDGTPTVSTTMDYDLSGRRTEGPWDSVTYTHFDLPRTVVMDGDSTTYLYDGDRRRVAELGPKAKVVRIAQLYERRDQDGQVEHVFLVSSDSGVVAQVTQKEGETDRDIHYVHRDRRGGAAVVTDAAAAVTTGQWFTPFGQPAKGEGRPSYGSPSDGVVTGFTGHRNDDVGLGLIDMNGRVYDPVGSTFLTPDPIVSQPFFGQDHNRYSYAFNNPLKYTDPTGLYEGAWDYYVDANGPMRVRTIYDDATDEAIGYEFDIPGSETGGGPSQGDDNLDDVGGVDDANAGATVERTERMRFDVSVHYPQTLLDGADLLGNPQFRREMTTERLGSVTIEFTYTRDASGRREVFFDPLGDVDIDVRNPWYTDDLDLSIGVRGSSRRVGETPEVNFVIDVYGPTVSSSDSASRGETSGTRSIQVPLSPGGPSFTAGQPTQQRSQAQDVRSTVQSHFPARGRIRISTQPGVGPELVVNPGNRTGQIRFGHSAVGPDSPATVETAYVTIDGPDWSVVSR